MKQLNANALRNVRTADDVLTFLGDELDWPVATDDLDEATFDWDPAELGIPLDRVPHFVSLRQLRPLETNQPWGVFFLEFDGPRLPLSALRKLLDRLVTKKRATSGTLRTWKLDDLLFVITTSGGDAVEFHFVAFFERPDQPAEIRSIPWRPGQSPSQHLRRVACELLPHLAWPDDPDEIELWRQNWRAAFKLRHGEAIQTVTKLVDRMATTARILRDSIAAALDSEQGNGPFSTLLVEVRTQLVGSVTKGQFSDMCAQTLVYGAMTSRVTDPAAFGASPTLSSIPLANPFLAAFFEEVHDHAAQLDGDNGGLEQLVADLRASNVEAILDQFGSTARGGDPVIHFYEEFLHRYDPEMKVQAGAFYTPQPVVAFMVRTVDELLRDRFGLELGLADPATWGEVSARLGIEVPDDVDPEDAFVSMIDPATGTGTFLVEWLRQSRRSFDARGAEAGWLSHLRTVVLPSIHAFELMLAPFAIAHLKVALEVHEQGAEADTSTILLCDTLEGATHRLPGVFAPLAEQGAAALEHKRDTRFTIAVGNPPYLRADRESTGGWVVQGQDGSGPPIFEDILRPARENTAFGHLRSLSNLYVYFWRWGLWKVLEADAGPGIVAFITASSWLRGPGFMGLRALARRLGNEIVVVDLGGDSRGARPEENVFDIQTPVAIVFVVRAGRRQPEITADVSYTRVSGSREEKLAALEHLDATTLVANEPTGTDVWLRPLAPTSGGLAWEEMVALFDLFPWQQPGCLASRTWPIAPSAELLHARWARFVGIEDLPDRADAFRTAKTGRNIHTRVPGMARLADLDPTASHEPVVRYGYRSFDRQWIFEDARLLKTEAPSLWAVRSDAQVFMCTLSTTALGSGPAATVFACVPDYHAFRGSYGGKDIVPLYRDAARTPNLAQLTLDAITGALRSTQASAGAVSARDMFAYCYAILAGADYTARFAVELETPGPRVPVSADASLFTEVVDFGSELLWLHTFGERFSDGHEDHSLRDERVRLAAPITSIPEKPKDNRYDEASQTLFVGDGRIEGVTPDVWAFEVSGMPVVSKWLGYRTAKGAGRAASSTSPLDQIRPTEWSAAWTEELLDLLSILQRTIDLLPTGTELLDRILEGPLVSASDLLPVPPELREPPTVHRANADPTLGV